MALQVFTGDDIEIAVVVRDRDGNTVDITGATIDAYAYRRQTSTAGGVTLDAPTNGIFTINFPDNSLSEGVYKLQARVTLGTVSRTVVSETLVVRKGPASGGDWILATGFWDDNEVWDDNENWQDA